MDTCSHGYMYDKEGCAENKWVPNTKQTIKCNEILLRLFILEGYFNLTDIPPTQSLSHFVLSDPRLQLEISENTI